MTPALALEKTTYLYADGRKALDAIDLSIEVGERVGLIGTNGAGKTTLFRLAAGLIPPRDGSVRVFGSQYASRTDRELRRRVGIVFQETEDQIFCPTVAEEVGFGPHNFGRSADDVQTLVSEALELVGLSGYESRLPHQLSSGERRRVALASVLSYRPDLLLLDEPTSDLDPRRGRELARLLRSLDVTQLIASHDLEFVLLTCDRIALLDEGRLVATGPTTDLIADAARLERHGLDLPLGLRPLPADELRRLVADWTNENGTQ